MPARRTQDVTVKLSGVDGNVFAVIGTVYLALRQEGFYHEAQQFKRQAFSAGNYDQVLRLAMETVNVV